MQFLKKINYRITLITIIILFQLYWGTLFLLRIVDYAEWFSTALSVISIVVVLFMNMKEENASYKIGWIILIMALPVFGGLFYLLFGNKRPSRFMRRRLIDEHRVLEPLLTQQESYMKAMEEKHPRHLGTAKYVCRENDYPVYGNTQVKYYPLGEAQYIDMLEALEKAEKFIFMEYFIVEEGRMWQGILDILVRKAKEGVEVCFIYDDVGSMFLLPKDFQKKLEALGIRCMAFNPFRPLLSVVMNHRNHRKILVVDGHTAFTGGINIADEYINEKERFGHWKDTGIRLQGEGVLSFTLMFVSMWNAFRKDKIDPMLHLGEQSVLKSFQQEGFVQPFSDTPLDQEPLGENIYIEILSQAKDYVYIFTPYLIIDNELQSALCLAAKRGVDVRIVTPGIPDKKVVFRVTRSNYFPLIRAGVRIYEYTPGFMHAKSFVSDDHIGVVGTINMDYRSLYLHFECGALLYGQEALMDLKKDSLETISKSKEIHLKDIKKGPLYHFVDALLRAFAILF